MNVSIPRAPERAINTCDIPLCYVLHLDFWFSQNVLKKMCKKAAAELKYICV